MTDLEKSMDLLSIAQAKTEAQLNKTIKILSGIGINLGKATEQLNSFRKLFLQFANYKIYLGMAGFPSQRISKS